MQMTQLRLHRDLSYCRVDGHLIFLDIQKDRYFRLTECLESALITYLDSGYAPDSSIRRLIERKILIDGSIDSDYTPRSIAKIPTRSAMEEAVHAKRPSVGEALDTLAIVCSTQMQLKARGLKQVLGKLASLRGKRTSRPSTSRHGEPQVLDAAAAFRSARLYIPIDTCCLLDSIAMVRFLANRGLHADLVFGVTADPFSAHCWAQYGTTVLNDALGHALAHTPIRVI
jgi:hypothetical protein